MIGKSARSYYSSDTFLKFLSLLVFLVEYTLINLLLPAIKWVALIKMFSPFGKIVSEDFLWHTRGPKKGEPRGYAFIQYSNNEEAELAKEKMHGRLACGRPLVVRLASEKHLEDSSLDYSKRSLPESNRTKFVIGSSPGQMNRNEKVAAIKNKLKALEKNEKQDPKKQKR